MWRDQCLPVVKSMSLKKTVEIKCGKVIFFIAMIKFISTENTDKAATGRTQYINLLSLTTHPFSYHTAGCSPFKTEVEQRGTNKYTKSGLISS